MVLCVFNYLFNVQGVVGESVTIGRFMYMTDDILNNDSLDIMIYTIFRKVIYRNYMIILFRHSSY
jgi:hypothetical protein